MLKEIHNQRFMKVIEEEKNSKIWTIESLKEKINFLLPSNIIMTERQIPILINTQQHFKVFKCKVQHEKGSKTYYIFRRYLPG